MWWEYQKTLCADLNAYAAAQIEVHRKRRFAEYSAELVEQWIQERRVIWWTRNAPFPLDDRQRVRASALNGRELVLVDRTGVEQATISIADINPIDLAVEDSREELREIEQKRLARAARPVMTADHVTALLAKVSLFAQYPQTRPTPVIEVARSDDWFALRAGEHLRGSGLSHTDINAFVDRKTNPLTIRLRPGAKGVGTEVHETLHTRAADKYRDAPWGFFFDEGITEYFTQKATEGEFDREDNYNGERAFIQQLVAIGATDDVTLANLYFAGAWASFEQGIRTFAGDWVSIKAVRAANRATGPAVCDYLKELSADKRAPLGPEPPPNEWA
jgi:hypothetical protein